MKRLKALLLLIIVTVSFATAQEINVAQIKKDVYFLASDKLAGRGTSDAGGAMAARYICSRFKQIGLLPKGDNNGYLKAYEYKAPANPHMGIDSAAKTSHSNNVVGYIDNGAPNTIIIGAHYDHLGKGYDGNSLDANPQGKIHNGADDNASGVAGVIALANYYQKNNVKEKYNLLFICFSGEELGLYGSKKFCDNPSIDLSTVDFMLNMDMIGRLDSLNRLLVYGVGTAADLYSVIKNTKTDFKIKTDSSGIGPSDHTSFYLKDIPVLHFFTGSHSDYHKPSDKADKVNYEGEKKVLEYIVAVVNELDSHPKLKFTATRNADNESSPKFKVTLGIMPDYVFEGPGVRADGVTNGKPASKAGMLKGDIIIKLGDYDVKDLKTYMEALAKFKKGDNTTVEVQRGKEKIKMPVTF